LELIAIPDGKTISLIGGIQMKIRFRQSPVLFLFIVLFSLNTAQAQSDREEWQPPGKIMDAIGVKPGMIIGEAGAGRGYMTFYLAGRVGSEGKVYANDISRSALDEITKRAKSESVENIEVVMGEIEDPLFPADKLDMVIMVYVLHMLDRPMEFMENLRKYMTPETPLVIIERNTRRERSHPPSFMTNREILETLQETDYVLERTETFLPKDTIYIFKLKKQKSK
jgi:ubiquinone/menaquinone biosynthesis C-methylase UbiE